MEEKDNDILYSIIVPVYNVEKYLAECIESIIKQSYQKWEAILVDDGSTDENSAKICDEYEKKDKRIRVYHLKNQGSLLARRYGFQKSYGEFILFADSDDYLDKDLLLTVNDIITKNKCDLVIYRAQWFSDLKRSFSRIVFSEGTVIGEDGLSKEALWEKVVSCGDLNNLWLKVTKRENIDEDSDLSKIAFLQSGTDLMQSLPILENAKKIYFSEKVLYNYRFNDSGISSKKKKQTDLKSIEKHLKTRRILLDEKLKYLKKNNLDNPRLLKIHYKICFVSGINLLVSWLVNEKNRKNKIKIMEKMLNENDFVVGKKYLSEEDFSGVYRLIYKLYVKQKKCIKTVIQMNVFKVKVADFIYNFIYRVLKQKNT